MNEWWMNWYFIAIPPLKDVFRTTSSGIRQMTARQLIWHTCPAHPWIPLNRPSKSQILAGYQIIDFTLLYVNLTRVNLTIVNLTRVNITRILNPNKIKPDPSKPLLGIKPTGVNPTGVNPARIIRIHERLFSVRWLIRWLRWSNSPNED